MTSHAIAEAISENARTIPCICQLVTLCDALLRTLIRTTSPTRQRLELLHRFHRLPTIPTPGHRAGPRKTVQWGLQFTEK